MLLPQAQNGLVEGQQQAPAARDVSETAVRDQLRKLLQSSEFCTSHRMCRFLSFVVNETLAGRAEQLKEYTIGVNVYDRLHTFDPSADPIVRVEARRLRDKLERYYQAHGNRGELIIEMPKGTYVPRYSRPDDGSGAEPFNAFFAVCEFASLSAPAEQIAKALASELVDQLRHEALAAKVALGIVTYLRERQSSQ